ncbi:hypothetical protein JD79_00349 [Geodermatophilus normandii]|uniref:Uncharacterized protein n=1 Tax=Geodermatophilus normandii TaxID=1137989 RepID=A0A317QE91_9ACTN|nr:hypothetical protein [Geodermatophilus normandii]PWW21221.1 hypothetical protein JD79_00349 [Geodermatophilus normandii]
MHARRTLVVIAGTVGLALLAPGTASAAPGGCQAFGENVAGLATSLGARFGANASGAARLFPGAFPAIVVHPEQERFCP